MQRKALKKRTSIIGFVKEHNAIIEGINAGLADVKAGRIYTHKKAMIHIAQKFESLKHKTK